MSEGLLSSNLSWAFVFSFCRDAKIKSLGFRIERLGLQELGLGLGFKSSGLQDLGVSWEVHPLESQTQV